MRDKDKIVIVSGYFNPVHSGHIKLFESAKKLGNKLIVILNSDNQVKLKGSFPFMSEIERKKIVESIKYVDDVFISIDKDKTVCKTIEKVYKKFSKKGVEFIFANGGDRKMGDVPEDDVCKSLSIAMKYNIGGGKSQSSSWLIGKAKKCKEHNEELIYCEKCFNDRDKKIYKRVEVERPWGSYLVLEEGKGYKVKVISVKSKKRLSLQSHNFRSEHWVVISGQAKVTIDNKEFFLKEGESVFVSKKTKHRLENPFDKKLEIVEVQNGKYLEEDDIIRFDDDYNRIK